jgi:hypothetical protein
MKMGLVGRCRAWFGSASFFQALSPLCFERIIAIFTLCCWIEKESF